MKTLQKIGIVVLCLFGPLAQARRPVPLMPPRAVDADTPSDSVGTSLNRQSEPKQLIGFGAEFGVLGNGVDSGGDALGMQVFWGGRIFARIPLTSRIYLKPSLGYFRGSQGAGQTSVTQNVFEGGLGAYYALLRGSRLRWLVGLSQRLDGQLSVINAPGGVSSTSPMAFRYRLGPATGLAMGLSPDVSLVTDFEVTIPTVSPVKPVAVLSAGVIFYLR